MRIQFFGEPNSQRLGVYHAPRRSSLKAIVLCPPLGQEYIRTHWAMKILANQLCRKGIHVLRFDYRGHGDSFGNIQDVASMDEWKQDASDAIDFLKQAAGTSNVALLGLRAGAMIASEVAQNRNDINSLVAWERFFDGKSYLNELRQVHKTMLDFWFTPVTTPNDEASEEILGWRFQRPLLDQIQSWHEDLGSLSIPQLSFELGDRDTQSQSSNPMQRVICVDDESDWTLLGKLESAWLRPKTTQRIVHAVDDLFHRLEKHQMLGRPQEQLTAGAV